MSHHARYAKLTIPMALATEYEQPLQKAARYRRIADYIVDTAMIRCLIGMAEECETRAMSEAAMPGGNPPADVRCPAGTLA